MSEVTVTRICNPGWKNCKMPELRERIAELEKEKLKQDAELRTEIKTINEALELALTDLVKSDICVGELEAQIKAVKALPVYYIATGEIAPKDEFSVHIMIKPFELDKALEQDNARK